MERRKDLEYSTVTETRKAARKLEHSGSEVSVKGTVPGTMADC